MFDLRHLEHSTIIFEEPTRAPLLRLACNKQDHNYIATFAQESTEVCFIWIILTVIITATTFVVIISISVNNNNTNMIISY